MYNLIREKINEILIGHVFINPVADINIAVAVVVHIKHQGAPAPVGGRNAGEKGDFAECFIFVIELKAVLHVLMVETALLLELIDVVIFKKRGGFEARFVAGQHFGSENFGVSVVVDIGHVGAHGSMAHVRYPLFNFFFKRAVFLVDIQVIPLKKVIGNIEIWPQVAIDITDSNAQSKANQAAINARGSGYIDKFTVVIAQEFVAAAFQKIAYRPVFGIHFPVIAVIQGIHRHKTVVQNITIQVAIEVVIKKSSVGGISILIQAVFSGFFYKNGYAILYTLIDKQFIFRLFVFIIACITHINIE